VTLIDFLTAQLDEEQRPAEAASPGPWHTDEEGEEVCAVDGIVTAEAFALSGNQTRATAAFIAANNPSRALAEIAAKRAILKLHARAHECSVIDEQGDIDPCYWVMETESCSTVALLAQPYRDRPDFDERWAT